MAVNEKLCHCNLDFIRETFIHMNGFLRYFNVICIRNDYPKSFFVKLQIISPARIFLRLGKASLLQIFIAMKHSPFSDFVKEGNIHIQMTFATSTSLMTIFPFNFCENKIWSYFLLVLNVNILIDISQA